MPQAPSSDAIELRIALASDLDALVPLMRDFYAHEGLRFDAKAARAVVARLIGDPSLGRAWVILAAARPAGYVVLTLGYSLEFRGRDAFLDEIYLDERLRGRGIGEKALEVVEAACRELGVNALHLEVERKNERALALYRRRGFEDHERALMTKWIAR